MLWQRGLRCPVLCTSAINPSRSRLDPSSHQSSPTIIGDDDHIAWCCYLFCFIEQGAKAKCRSKIGEYGIGAFNMSLLVQISWDV
ncbi:hypothetical protein ASPVEDRAFT_43537, partial [Aspergillus versicolor CBS 583.65]